MNNETVVDEEKWNDSLSNFISKSIFYIDIDNNLNEYGLKKGLIQEEMNLLPTPWLEKILYNEWLKDEESFIRSIRGL